MCKTNKSLTMLDILKFESSTKEKDKELQNRWDNTMKEFCDLCEQRLKITKLLKIIDLSHDPIRFLDGYTNCVLIITPHNFRTLLLSYIYTTKKGELRCGLEDELKRRNIILYDTNFIKALEEIKDETH